MTTWFFIELRSHDSSSVFSLCLIPLNARIVCMRTGRWVLEQAKK